MIAEVERTERARGGRWAFFPLLLLTATLFVGATSGQALAASAKITATQFGSAWPFTVLEGVLSRRPDGGDLYGPVQREADVDVRYQRHRAGVGTSARLAR